MFDIVLAEEASPTGHALLGSPCHGHRKKLLLVHTHLEGVPQIGRRLAARCVLTVAAKAIRVEDLITMEDSLRNLDLLALYKKREIQFGGRAIRKCVGIQCGWG